MRTVRKVIFKGILKFITNRQLLEFQSGQFHDVPLPLLVKFLEIAYRNPIRFR